MSQTTGKKFLIIGLFESNRKLIMGIWFLAASLILNL